MTTSTSFKRSLRKSLTYITTVTTVVWSMGGALLPLPASAAVTVTTAGNSPSANYSRSNKAGGNAVPMVFAFTQNSGETFSTLTFTLSDVNSSSTAATDFGRNIPGIGEAKVLLLQDNTSSAADDFNDDINVTGIVATSNTLNIGTATTLTLSGPPANTIPASMSGRGSHEWALVFLVSASAVNGHQFRVDLAANAIATSINSPTITAVTGNTFTIDTTAPAAIADGQPGSGGPPNNQQYVPPDALIDRGFSEALDGSTVTTGTVSLKRCTGADTSSGTTACATVDTTNLCTTVTLDPSTRITCNHSPLAVGTWQELRVATGVTDLATNALAADYVVRLKTSEFFGGSGGTNTTPPRVASITPPPGSIIPVNALIFINFPMGPEGDLKVDGTTGAINGLGTVSLKKRVNGAPTTEVCSTLAACGLTADNSNGAWAATARQLKINTATDLDPDSEYDLCVRGTPNSSALKNMANQSMTADACYGIRTTSASAGTDSTAPTLRLSAQGNPTFPSNGATGVTRYTPEMQVFFSEAMDPSTLTLGTTIGLYGDTDADGVKDEGESVLGSSQFTINYDTQTNAARLGLKGALTENARFCFYLTNGVKDLANNALAASSNQCFTTAAAAADTDTTAPTIQFADADNFKLVAHYSEAMNATDVQTSTNYSLECPVGVTIPLTGKPFSYRPDLKEVEIQQLGLQNDQNCRLTVTGVKDLAGNNIDTSNSNNVANFKVLNSTTTGGYLGQGGMQGGGEFYAGGGGSAASFWEKPQRCEPRNRQISKSTSIDCEFSVPQALTTGATLLLTFPTGFNVASAAAPAATQSWSNADLNSAAPGITTISALSANNSAGTVLLTLAHSGDAMLANDMLRFELSGITTPATAADDIRISIVVKDSSGVKVGQTIQPAPFSIQQGGSLSISGKVCKGSSSEGTCGGSDTAIANVKVVCNQMGGFMAGTTGGMMMGMQEATTNASGDWSITGLTAGQYGCHLPPQSTALADTGGMNPWIEVPLSTANATSKDFKFVDLSATGKSLTVTVSGINDADATNDADLFCHSGMNDFQFSAPVIKPFDFATAGNTTVTVKLQGGKTYECGVGPTMPEQSFQNGGPPPMPEFNFMPTKPVQVVVPTDSNPSGITFALNTANLTIVGKVVDGSNNNIANVFVHADPIGCFDPTTGERKECMGSGVQSTAASTGNNFSLKVVPGAYEIGADGPGLPPSSREEVTVASNGTMTQGGTTVTSITLKMVKSSTTISGAVKDESGNGIQYAQVSAERRTIASGSDACDFSNSRPSGGRASSPTDSSGNYTLYVSNGTWCVRAFAQAYGEVGTRTIVVSGNTSQSNQDIQATASEYGTISGTVTKGGTATGGAYVNCYGSAGGNGMQAATDGSWSLKVKAGTYTCEGMLPGNGPLTPVGSIVVTSSSTTPSSVTLSMGNPGTVNVTITGITDAFVDLRSSSTGRGHGTGQNNNGVYSVTIPAGTYTVRGMGPKYGELCSGQTVTVTAGGTHAVTCTPPSNTRTVTGRVTDGTNNIEGVTVTFSSTGGKIFKVPSDAKTGSNNNLSATGVPEGTYTVRATKKGYEPASTTAVVSGGNLTLSSAIALTKSTASGQGTTVTIPVQESSTAYAGDATVVATKDGKVVVAETEPNTGEASLPLTNGTWTVKAVGDNGKESTSSTVTVASGALSGSAPTLSLANTITGFTARSESQTMPLKTGGLLKYNDLAVGGVAPEVSIPANALSTTDSSTGKVDMKADPTLKDIDPGTNENFVGSHGYELTPKDANGKEVKDLNGTVTITIPYSDSDVTTAGVDESKLQFASFNTSSQAWETFPTTVDTTNNLLVAQVDHFSSFGVIGTVTTSSSSSTGRGDTTPPGDVTATAATSANGKITLTWTDPTDSDLRDILVYRNYNPSGNVINGGLVYATVTKGVKTYTDNGPFPAGSGPYAYQFVARDTAGNTSLATVSVSTALVPAVQTGGGAGAGSTTTPATTPAATGPATTPAVTPATPAAPAAPAVAAAADRRAQQIADIVRDALALRTDNAEGLAQRAGTARDTALEANTLKKIVRKFIKAGAVDSAVEERIVLAVAYPLPSVQHLGAGEIAGVINSYKSAFGRLPDPANPAEWEDMLKIGNGRFPSQEAPDAVERAQKQFKKVYVRDADMTLENDKAAVTVIAYGLRPDKRNLASEAGAIKIFRGIFKRSPSTALDWDTVRAIAYSGATR